MTRIAIDLGIVDGRQFLCPIAGAEGNGHGFNGLILGFGLDLNRVFRHWRELTVAEQVLHTLAPEDLGNLDIGESLT